MVPEIGEIRSAKKLGKSWYLKYIWAACEKCGKQRWVVLSKGKPISIYCRCCGQLGRTYPRGASNPSWKGGRRITNRGYITVWLSPESPYSAMAQSNDYVFEHRLVMAEYLGRCLLPSEKVHHINGNKQDNRPNNLMLLARLGLHGQSHSIDIQWAFERGKREGLEIRIASLEKEIRLLKWQVRELTKTAQLNLGAI